MAIFTAFCQEIDGSGTIWINPIHADSLSDAMIVAVESCAADWAMDVEEVRVLGIAAGDVDILHWEDLAE
jgi:hypothetical protein